MASLDGTGTRKGTPEARELGVNDAYGLKVFDDRERIVETVQEFAPLLVLRRSSESFGVVFKLGPLDQKEICAWSFQAPREGEALKSWHRRDDRLCASKSGFELILLADNDGK